MKRTATESGAGLFIVRFYETYAWCNSYGDTLTIEKQHFNALGNRLYVEPTFQLTTRKADRSFPLQRTFS
jgi:hypothetical protein